MITTQAVAEKIDAYLNHRVTLPQLVDWAENAFMDGEFEAQHSAALTSVVSRLGVADVRAFGLTWEDCEGMLKELGFAARVSIQPA